jgi:biopolymer transport protein ExbB/TolQ
MRPLSRWLLIGGLMFCIGAPSIGGLFTVFGMVGAFHKLGQSGIANPEQLSTQIGNALAVTEVGMLLAILGLPLLIAVLVIHLMKRDDLSEIAKPAKRPQD